MTQLPIQDLFAQASRLETDGKAIEAADLYKSWLALNPNSGFLHGAYFNYSVSLTRAGDRAGAINALRECIRIKPDFHPPYINLGRLLEDFGQPGAAVGKWLDLIRLLVEVNGASVRNKLMTLQQMGRVLEGAHKDAAAEDALRQSLDIKADQSEVAQHWIALRQRQCRWPVIEDWDGVSPKALLRNISPLSAAVMLDDPVFQLARNQRYARDTIARPPADRISRHDPGTHHRGDKLRIGYVSSDLREHAVGFGLAELMGVHDRERFEIHAYYCGIRTEDPTKARICGAVQSWTDISSMTDDAAANCIAKDGIDIVVDLNGYTRDARTAIFARRPAPIAVNWYGFPGTMGTPFHNYIIADDFLIPKSDEIYYSEKVVRLPFYQPNDRHRPVAHGTQSREREQLPPNAFVYCCLNGTQKITPTVFSSWLRILKSSPNSVLWLLESTPETMQRLRNLAASSGLKPDRLIFAPKRPNPEHLARYQLADLFLDTSPYGAHTTAADALWMGVPILTVPGVSFASRVCADVVRAAGLPDLVCASVDELETRAIALAHDPDGARKLRERIEQQRSSSLLFNTDLLTRSLEQLYEGMWSDFEAGQLPIPNLRNLDEYFEIGLDICLQPSRPTCASALKQAYVAGLTAWDKAYPLEFDPRLWFSGARDHRDFID
jgi:predicted O-linked N-acetylglucosamine transferase (SPINDLY family)